MKRLILLFIAIYQLGYGQSLIVGVPTTVNLISDSHNGGPIPGGCFDWTIDQHINIVYASGMKLYYRIDSLVGTLPNSVKIYRFPDYLNTFINTNDTIPVKPSSNSIYVYFTNPTCVYITMIAVGTPSVAGESYYCNFSKSYSIDMDGCSRPVVFFAGGNGPLDNVKGCTVGMSTDIAFGSPKFKTRIYPNPSNNLISIETDTPDKKVANLYDVSGRQILTVNLNESSIINVNTLDEGVYTLNIRSGDQIINKKIIIVK